MNNIEQFIYLIRGKKVMLDSDLAMLYGIETKNLKRAVKRNNERFPKDFMFELEKFELENWRCQFGTSNSKVKMGLRRMPYAFTEQGVAMLSSVLRSPQAVTVNIEIIRAFIQMRHALVVEKEIAKDLKEMKSFLIKRSNSTDREFRKIWKAIEKITKKAEEPKEPERKIGFKLK